MNNMNTKNPNILQKILQTDGQYVYDYRIYVSLDKTHVEYI